jgi:RHS repeat-associated protein
MVSKWWMEEQPGRYLTLLKMPPLRARCVYSWPRMAVGRVRLVRQPNGSRVEYYYAFRNVAPIQFNSNGIGRLLGWQDYDDLGRMTLLRNYKWENNNWQIDGERRFTYDGADRLREVRWSNNTLLTSMTYDLAGRKLSMWDADLGSWSYAYDTLGNLTRQTDARNYSTCLSYDNLNRLSSKTVRSGNHCGAAIAAAYTYSYDSWGRLSGIQQTHGGNWSKSYAYNTLGLLGYEQVSIDNQARGISHYYDQWHRPYAVSYPDGEVVKVNFNALGLPSLLCKSYLHSSGQYWCDSSPRYADNASYDVAGRLTAVQYPAGGNLWRTQSYYGWSVAQHGGLLDEIRVGTTNGSNNRFYRKYSYNGFGEVATLQEGSTTFSFGYDDRGRLTSAYSGQESFIYYPTGRIQSFKGSSYDYASHPYHAVDTVNGVDRYDYDANGNMTVRNKGLSSRQTLEWNAENRLQTVRNNSGAVIESYVYDVDGNRIKKTSGSTVTRTFFPGHYEEEGSTAIKHYRFNGQIIATRRGGTLRYTHTDHLGSTSGQTDTSGNAVTGTYLRYFAYGALRAGDPATPNTDRTFTGQKQDGTGLLYYNARYYDPSLGTFISPDTLVPDAKVLYDYNRFMYARGNPLKYTDPSGHCATTSNGREDWNDAECWTTAHSILNMWDDTDYWQNRYTSKEVFRQIASVKDNDAAMMRRELQWYFESDAYQQWRQQRWEQSSRNQRYAGGDPILEAFDAYCSTRDCEAVMLDGIGFAATVSVAVACIPGFAVCGTVMFVGTGVATVAGGIGVARTAANVVHGKATTTDLLVSTTTFAVGFGGGKSEVVKAVVGVGAASTQLYWDHVNPTRQVPRYE